MSKLIGSDSVVVTNVVGIKGELEEDQSFFVAADDFFKAAKLLYGEREAPTRAIAFLCGQATECYLKALLRNAGIDTEALRKKPYGHNLENLWASAQTKGLVPQAPSWLGKLNKVHNFPYEGRYPMGLNMQVYPDPNQMMPGIQDLNIAVMNKFPLAE